MPQKKHKRRDRSPPKLRQVDVFVSQGQSVAEAVGVDRRDAVHLLPVAQGVRRPEGRPGERLKELEKRTSGFGSRLRPDAGEADPTEGRLGKLLSPAPPPLPVSTTSGRRFRCRNGSPVAVLGQHRSRNGKGAARG